MKRSRHGQWRSWASAIAAILVVLAAGCQSTPIQFEDYRWVGGRGGTYKTWDMHLGKCKVWAASRNHTKHQKLRREDVDKCMDQHHWVRAD